MAFIVSAVSTGVITSPTGGMNSERQGCSRGTTLFYVAFASFQRLRLINIYIIVLTRCDPQAGINCAMFTGRGAYPTADGIDEAREMARRIGATSIVSVGRGGTIDTAKAAARLHSSR